MRVTETDSVLELLEPSVQVTDDRVAAECQRLAAAAGDVAARGDARVVGRGVAERRDRVSRRAEPSVGLVIVSIGAIGVEARHGDRLGADVARAVGAGDRDRVAAEVPAARLLPEAGVQVGADARVVGRGVAETSPKRRSVDRPFGRAVIVTTRRRCCRGA